jgi:hypothetical protein
MAVSTHAPALDFFGNLCLLRPVMHAVMSNAAGRM